jgi:signal transduction protein with GAF and PtsI domain
MTDSQSLQEKSLLACVEIGKAVTATLHMAQILEIVLDRLSRLIRAKNWTLFQVDPITHELRFEVVAGLQAQQVGNIRIKIGEGIAGTAARTGEPILVPDAASGPCSTWPTSRCTEASGAARTRSRPYRVVYRK